MAVLDLFRLRDHVSPRMAVFPTDYDIIGQTLIDNEIADHDAITRCHWLAINRPGSKTTYATNRPRVGSSQQTRYLHRVAWEILRGPIPQGLTIDHIDRNGLNNLVENLRLATQREQKYNCEKRRHSNWSYKGIRKVHGHKRTKPFAGLVVHEKKTISLGYYGLEVEAALAHNIAAELTRGEFAWFNPIPPGSVSPARQLEIRSIVERKLRDRGLISPGN